MGQSLNPASIICGSFLEKLLNLFHVALQPSNLYTENNSVFIWVWEGNGTPVFLPGKSHGQRRLAGLQSTGSKRVGHNWAAKQQHNNMTTNYVSKSDDFIFIFYSGSLNILCSYIFTQIPICLKDTFQVSNYYLLW